MAIRYRIEINPEYVAGQRLCCKARVRVFLPAVSNNGSIWLDPSVRSEHLKLLNSPLSCNWGGYDRKTHPSKNEAPTVSCALDYFFPSWGDYEMGVEKLTNEIDEILRTAVRENKEMIEAMPSSTAVIGSI